MMHLARRARPASDGIMCVFPYGSLCCRWSLWKYERGPHQLMTMRKSEAVEAMRMGFSWYAAVIRTCILGHSLSADKRIMMCVRVRKKCVFSMIYDLCECVCVFCAIFFSILVFRMFWNHMRWVVFVCWAYRITYWKHTLHLWVQISQNIWL